MKLNSPAISHDDIVSPRLYADERAFHQMLEMLRATEPVRWTKPADYRPFWAVTRHADIFEVEQQSEVFQVGQRNRLVSILEEERTHAATGSHKITRSLPTMDEPEHRKYRAITQDWFRPANLARLDGQISAIVDEHIDRINDKIELEFVRTVSLWIPLRVIMLILGVPATDAHMMHRLTGELFSPHDPDIARTDDSNTTTGAMREFFDYFRALLAERREQPTDDLLSVIANATVDGSAIGEAEALAYCVSIVAAGHDTTAASIAGGVEILARNPEIHQALRFDKKLISAATEEVLRMVSPVRSFMRVATRDYDLTGTSIRNGDAVLLLYPSANRDKEVFADPNEFRLDRRRNQHLAFGAGPHLCLGMMLARKEISRFLERFVDRFARVEFAGEPRWLQTNFLGGLKALPVRCYVN